MSKFEYRQTISDESKTHNKFAPLVGIGLQTYIFPDKLSLDIGHDVAFYNKINSTYVGGNVTFIQSTKNLRFHITNLTVKYHF